VSVGCSRIASESSACGCGAVIGCSSAYREQSPLDLRQSQQYLTDLTLKQHVNVLSAIRTLRYATIRRSRSLVRSSLSSGARNPTRKGHLVWAHRHVSGISRKTKVRLFDLRAPVVHDILIRMIQDKLGFASSTCLHLLVNQTHATTVTRFPGSV
jgi:hypothetical protein